MGTFRKILLVLGFLGIGAIALLASGTFYAAREARDFVTTEVDKERAARCKAMRAEFQESWSRAVDSGRLEQVEPQLTAREREIDAYCSGK
jgi:hypothetical protein